MTSQGSRSQFADRIQADQLAGLSPRRWVAVGPGFSREDLKAVMIDAGQGWVGEAVTTLPEIAGKIIAASASGSCAGARRAPVMASPAGRQDLLKLLLSDTRIAWRMPELRRLRRQREFFRKLDRALQAGRMAFSHEEELRVYEERLAERLGPSAERAVRGEIHALAVAYEAWMRANELWDVPLLFQSATERLTSSGWPGTLRRPEVILYFTAQVPESLERDFCDALSRIVRWERVGPLDSRAAEAKETREAESEAESEAEPEAESEAESWPRGPEVPWSWQRWHTIDDAAEALVDELASSEALSEHAVLIPDDATVRRCLDRALASAAIPRADPRDPTRLRWDESVKWALLPLDVVSSRFDRATVIAWLRATQLTSEFPSWVREINARGIRHGLDSYQGGLLSGVHSRLLELAERFAGRKTCVEVGTAHLSLLRASIGASGAHHEILFLLEKLWSEFGLDVSRLGQAEKRAPFPRWHERLRSRVREASAPAPALRPVDGVQVYRLSQAPLRKVPNLWILGLPPDWLEGEGGGDLWFNERERAALGSEFAVRSRLQVASERIAALASWLAGCRRVGILDASYEPDGRERESIAAALGRIGFSSAPKGSADARGEELQPEERGAHPRWAASYSALRPVPPLRVRLGPCPPADGSFARAPEITATALDHFSRCGFQGLAYHRWKLRDSREPGTELWPEARGTILHRAARLRLASRGADGSYALSIDEALVRAWRDCPPQGLYRSQRLEEHARARMRGALDSFFEKEAEYQCRAGPRTVSLDDRELRLVVEGITIVGKPDRIDETDDGLFLIDYKTSGDLPSGTEMVERGYRLQLPFYALAARSELGKPVLGVQFAEISRKASRSNGIFFGRTNGKEAGKLTCVRSNSRSLVPLEPEEAWRRVAERVAERARCFVSGDFEALPRAARPGEECARCRISDLCGLRRLAGDREDEREAPAGAPE